MALFNNSIDGLTRLQEELDRFFGRPMLDSGISGPSVFPAINVFTNNDGWVVRAEVPGVKPDRITIDVEPRVLKITGERPAPTSNAGVHRRERRFGKFSRTVQLPRELDTANATAEVKNGVLTVRIPKAAASKPRSIAVVAA